jgi:hypothetical protein
MTGAAYPAAIVRGMTDEQTETPPRDDDRLVIPLDPEVALAALLKVDLEQMPPEDDQPQVDDE